MSGSRTVRAVWLLLFFAAVPTAAQQDPMVQP